MKWHYLLLGLALTLASCQLGIGPAGKHPTRAMISGARGLYLEAGSKSIHVVRSVAGRSVVSATSATLGAISATGIPETASFTDDTGATVDVAITQALQLTDQYVLIAYSYDGGSGTGILDMGSGALANLTQVPDNWPLVFSRGSSAWYVSSGSLWRADLSSGEVTDLSDGSYTWTTVSTIAGFSSWQPAAWIYSDALGNVYAIDDPGGYTMAACIPSSGPAVDFGSNPMAYSFSTAFNGSVGTGSAIIHTAYDPATGKLYLLKGDDEWDGNPLAVGGASITGVVVQAFPVTLTPSGSVMSIATLPTAAAVMNASYVPTTYVGFASALTSALWTNGMDTVTGAVSGGTLSLTHYDTSGVPSAGSDGAVTNWQYSGGEVYAGPATQQTIGIVKLNGATGSATTLVNDSSPIVSWSVVGGVLFYTDDTGTYSATVNAQAATISTPQVYAGGAVQGITQ